MFFLITKPIFRHFTQVLFPAYCANQTAFPSDFFLTLLIYQMTNDSKIIEAVAASIFEADAQDSTTGARLMLLFRRSRAVAARKTARRTAFFRMLFHKSDQLIEIGRRSKCTW